jgi:hypothetical protein
MSAPDNEASVPKPLADGLLDGQAGNPVFVFRNFLQHAIAAMDGQNQHNVATTATLRNHQQTLVTHSTLMNANKTSIENLTTKVSTNKDSIQKQEETLESHKKLITANEDKITEHKSLIDANKDGVTSLKTDIEAKLKSHENWQDNFAELQEMVTNKNEFDILVLQKDHATQQLQLIQCDEKLDKQILALAAVGESALKQDIAITNNRSRTISNAQAINALQSDMVIEQEITDERFGSINTNLEHRSSFDKEMAATFKEIGMLFNKISTGAQKLHADIKKAKYDDKKMEEWLPPTLQERYRTRRRKRGLRKTQKVWQKELAVPKVTVGKPYKKARLEENNNWKSVATEATTACNRAATHAIAKVNAEMLLAQKQTALAAHDQKEERRREQAQERAERRQLELIEEEERRLQQEQQDLVEDQNGQKRQGQLGLQDPPSNKDDKTSEETDEEPETFITISPHGVVSPEN